MVTNCYCTLKIIVKLSKCSGQAVKQSGLQGVSLAAVFLDVTQRCFGGTLRDIQKTAASETPVIPTALQHCFLTYTRYTEFFKRAASSFCNLGF